MFGSKIDYKKLARELVKLPEFRQAILEQMPKEELLKELEYRTGRRDLLKLGVLGLLGVSAIGRSNALPIVGNGGVTIGDIKLNSTGLFENGIEITKSATVVVSQDGTGDYDVSPNEDASEVIQKAVDYVADKGGGVVYIREGEYLVRQTIAVKSYVSLQMFGATLKLDNGVNTDILKLSEDYASVIGGIIDGNKTNNTSGRGIVTPTITVYYCLVSNVRIVNTPEQGVFLDHANKCIVRDCVVSGAGKSGIEVINYAHYNLIANNVVENCGLQGILGWGGSGVSPCEGNRFVGNTCRNNVEAGIFLNGQKYAVCVGNYVEGNGDHGINAEYCDGISVIGNTAKYNVVAGIGFFNNTINSTIVGNVCYSNKKTSTGGYGNGIHLKTNSIRNVVCGNICYENENIGVLLDSEYNRATSNLCYNNNSHGILIISNCVVSDCTVYNNGGSGVVLQTGYSNMRCYDVWAEGNSGAGVIVLGNDCILENIYAVNNSTYGLQIVADNIRVIGGKVLGNTSGQVYKSGSNIIIKDVLGYNPQPPSSITVGSSPFTYQNTHPYPVKVLVSGGDPTEIDWSRDGVTWYNTGATAGEFYLEPGEYLKVTYATTAPTMIEVPL